MNLSQFLLVFAGSGFGGVARFFLVRHLLPHSHFPFGTFFVNVLACFLAGFFWAHSQISGHENPSRHLLLITGFCGGFSTFSAFGLDFLLLQQKGMTGISVFYLLASLFLCIPAVYAGYRFQQFL